MDITIPFFLLPGVAACLVGWAVRYASLAAAVACGALALMFWGNVPVLLWPLVLGAAAGAATLAIVLWLKPGTGPWARMTFAMLAALSAGMGLLYTALGGA